MGGNPHLFNKLADNITQNASEEPLIEAAVPETALAASSEAPLEPVLTPQDSEIPSATSANIDPRGLGSVLRGTTRPHFKNRGGARLHKDPNCACAGCTSRRRAEASKFSRVGGRESGVQTPAEAEVALQRIGDRTQIVAEEYNPNKTKKVAAKVRVAQWLGTKALEPELSNAEIARRMGISPPTLRAAITKGVQEGWLKFEDPIQAIEYQIIPKVVRNLNHFLDEGDKQVTIETAKGTLFKNYQEAVGITQAPQTVLALKIEFPEGSRPDPTTIMAGKIVGVPKISD